MKAAQLLSWLAAAAAALGQLTSTAKQQQQDRVCVLVSKPSSTRQYRVCKPLRTGESLFPTTTTSSSNTLARDTGTFFVTLTGMMLPSGPTTITCSDTDCFASALDTVAAAAAASMTFAAAEPDPPRRRAHGPDRFNPEIRRFNYL